MVIAVFETEMAEWYFVHNYKYMYFSSQVHQFSSTCTYVHPCRFKWQIDTKPNEKICFQKENSRYYHAEYIFKNLVACVVLN